MFLQQRRTNAPPQALPVLWPLCQRIQQLAPLCIILRKVIQVLSAQNVLDQAVAIENSAMCGILFILHDSAQDLEDRRDTTATTNHEKALHSPLFAIDSAEATTKVFKLADRAFKIDPMARRNRIECFRHLATSTAGSIGVDFDQNVAESLLCRLADGCVRADYGLAGHGVAETDHEMLAGGKTKGLVFVVEFEAEDACVPRDLLLRVQECFAPCAEVKEARLASWLWLSRYLLIVSRHRRTPCCCETHGLP